MISSVLARKNQIWTKRTTETVLWCTYIIQIVLQEMWNPLFAFQRPHGIETLVIGITSVSPEGLLQSHKCFLCVCFFLSLQCDIFRLMFLHVNIQVKCCQSSNFGCWGRGFLRFVVVWHLNCTREEKPEEPSWTGMWFPPDKSILIIKNANGK